LASLAAEVLRGNCQDELSFPLLSDNSLVQDRASSLSAVHARFVNLPLIEKELCYGKAGTHLNTLSFPFHQTAPIDRRLQLPSLISLSVGQSLVGIQLG
jgi:hypothetical protein